MSFSMVIFSIKAIDFISALKADIYLETRTIAMVYVFNYDDGVFVKVVND
jgi:hypothetical protein